MALLKEYFESINKAFFDDNLDETCQNLTSIIPEVYSNRFKCVVDVFRVMKSQKVHGQDQMNLESIRTRQCF